jgi:hypothetical protein
LSHSATKHLPPIFALRIQKTKRRGREQHWASGGTREPAH